MFPTPTFLAPTLFQLWRFRPWKVGPGGGDIHRRVRLAALVQYVHSTITCGVQPADTERIPSTSATDVTLQMYNVRTTQYYLMYDFSTTYIPGIFICGAIYWYTNSISGMYVSVYWCLPVGGKYDILEVKYEHKWISAK